MRFKSQTMSQVERLEEQLVRLANRVARGGNQDELLSMIENIRETNDTLKTFINSQPDTDDRMLDQYGNKMA